jgi:hypothetical protein
MENEPKTIHLLTHDLEETDKDFMPIDNDFDNIDGENILWCANEVAGMNNIKYIHHSEVERLVELAVDKALEVASEKAKINIWRNYPKVHDLDIINLTSHSEIGKDIIRVSKQSILSLKQTVLTQLNNKENGE